MDENKSGMWGVGYPLKYSGVYTMFVVTRMAPYVGYPLKYSGVYTIKSLCVLNPIQYLKK